RVARRRRQIIITLPLVITFASVVVLFIYASGWEENRLKLEFEHRTDNLAQQLTKTFVGYLDVLHSVENFFASTASVERNEFQTFAQRLISRHPGILAISWNIRVPDSERTNFEQAARADGSVNFQLTEMGPARELVPANRRSEYVPVYFLEPREANERALGFDTASDPLRGEALARARDTGEAAATGPITLVQETGREIGCVVYLP